MLMTCVATHCTLEPCRAFSFFFLPSIAWTLIIEWAYLCSQSCLHGRKELPWQLWMQMSIILQVGKRRQRCGNQTESPALSAVRPRYENVQKFTADNSTNVIVSLCYPCWIKRVCLQSIQAKTENFFFFFRKSRDSVSRTSYECWWIYAKHGLTFLIMNLQGGSNFF